MHREFEELGLTICGVGYGHFTGEVQFDETGAPVIIDIETANFGGSPLRLDIEDLVRERIALRRKLGTGFLEDGGAEVREHASKWTLFQGLSESIETRFKDDIIDYLADVRSDRGAAWNVA
jgi:hypothetical protein